MPAFASRGDLIVELARGVELTDTAISDLTVLGNITASVGFLAGGTSTLVIKLVEADNNFTKLDQTLFLLSKLPIIGGPVSAVRIAAKVVQKPIERVEDALDKLDDSLADINTALSGINVAIVSGLIPTHIANHDYQTRLDALNATDAIEFENISHQDLDVFKGVNDAVENIQELTSAPRIALDVLDYNAFDLIADLQVSITTTIDEINDILGEINDLSDELFDAIEPVSWVLSASAALQDEILNPIIDAVMDGTGLGDLLDDVTSQLGDHLSGISGFADGIDRIILDLELYDVGGLVEDFWGPYSELLDIGGPIELMTQMDSLTYVDAEGAKHVIGTTRDDDLQGTIGDDEFAPLEGDDKVDGLGGEDHVHYLHSIEDYKVEYVAGDNSEQDIQVAWRDEDIKAEGVDTLENIEILHFNTQFLGPVLREYIDAFEYTSVGNPNLTGNGDDNWLFGDDADNVLQGGAGDDHLFGGEGNDTLEGGEGADVILAGAGDDQILVDVRTGAGGLDRIDGGAGVDKLQLFADAAISIDFATGGFADSYGNVGVTTNIEEVEATGFDDTFYMAEGKQTVFTGGGADTIYYAGIEDTVYADEYSGTSVSFTSGGSMGVAIDHHQQEFVSNLSSTNIGAAVADTVGAPYPNDETLFRVSVFEGTDHADVFYSYGVTGGSANGVRNEFVHNHGGIDYLLTGSVFYGGEGTDVFFGSEFGSLFVGGDDFDLVNFSLDDSISERLGGDGIADLYINLDSGEAYSRFDIGKDDIANKSYLIDIEGVVGTRNADIIIGNDEANFLYGYLGQDTIEGGGGDDYIDGSYLTYATLSGGAGNDIIVVEGSEGAIVDGGEGSDTLELEPDQGFRLDAYFNHEAQGDLDQITSEWSQWTGWNVDLEQGTASAMYGPQEHTNGGAIEFNVELTSIENVFGSDFADTLMGNDEANILVGREGDDLIEGAGGNDFLFGGEGNDALYGGAGNDVLSGGAGNNYIYGDTGDDTIISISAEDDDPEAYDELTGGSGADKFVLDGIGRDVLVTDFESLEDVLAIYGGDALFEDLSFNQTDDGSTEVIFEGDVVATLANTDVDMLTSANFAFGAVAHDDQFELDMSEGMTIGNPLLNDIPSTEASSFKITAINGQIIEPDGTVTLASGAEVKLSPDGTLTLLDNDAYGEIGSEIFVENLTYEATDDAGHFSSGSLNLEISNTVIVDDDDFNNGDDDDNQNDKLDDLEKQTDDPEHNDFDFGVLFEALAIGAVLLGIAGGFGM